MVLSLSLTINSLIPILNWWWACSFSTAVYPSIFVFLSFSLHHWSTAMHHTDVTSHTTQVSLHDCSNLPSLYPIPLSLSPALCTRWTDDLQTLLLHSHFLAHPTLFLLYWFLFQLINSIIHYMMALISYPTCPVTGQLVTSCCTMWSGSQGTCCHFTKDEPCTQFLDVWFVFNCLYLLHTRNEEIFPQSADLTSSFSLITLCHLLQHTLASPCFIPSPRFVSPCTFISPSHFVPSYHFISHHFPMLPHP